MRRITILLTGFLALAVLTGGMAGMAAAEEPTAPEITADSDIDTDVVIEDFEADGDLTEVLEFETDTEEEIEEVVVNVTDGDDDRDAEYLEVTDADSAFETVEEDAEGVDIHQVEIDHDDLETVAGQIGEETVLEANIEIEDDDEGTALATVNFSVEFNDERAVFYVDEDAVDDDDVDVEVDSEDGDERSFPLLQAADLRFDSIGSLSSDDVEDIYHLEEEIEVTENTEIVVYLADSSVEDSFEFAADADEFDDGDVLTGLTMLEDGDFGPTFLNDNNSDFEGTQSVYHESSGYDKLVIEPGEDFDEEEIDDADDLDFHLGSHDPAHDNLVDRDDRAEVYVNTLELERLDLSDQFGLLEAFRMVGWGL